MKINAYAAFAPGEELKPYHYEQTQLPTHQVDIAVEYCGLCHSDLSMLDNTWGQSSYPLVLGHEIIGHVAALGSDVNNLKVGDRVGLGWHAGFCNQCDQCDTGDHNLCSGSTATIVNHHGGFAESVRADANALVCIPDGLDAASAGPLLCGGITVYNPLKQFSVKPTHRVAVIGIGGLGHLALQFCRAWGCEVTALTRSDDKADQAHELGAHRAITYSDTSRLKELSNHFDLIISTINHPLNWSHILRTLAPKGRLHFVGVPLEPLAIQVGTLLDKQLQISSSPVGSPQTMNDMLEFCVRHNIKPQVQQYALSDINAAISDLRNGKMRYRAVIKVAQ